MSRKQVDPLVERLVMIIVTFTFFLVLGMMAMPSIPVLPDPGTVWRKLQDIEIVVTHGRDETRYRIVDTKRAGIP